MPGRLRAGPAFFDAAMLFDCFDRRTGDSVKPLYLRAPRSMNAAALLVCVAFLPGCAGILYIAGEIEGVKEQSDFQTGSNLARRDKGNTGPREMDKDAIESSLRGINANRDNGR